MNDGAGATAPAASTASASASAVSSCEGRRWATGGADTFFAASTASASARAASSDEVCGLVVVAVASGSAVLSDSNSLPNSAVAAASSRY